MVKRTAGIPRIFSAFSPQALILIWLLHGFLPLTLSAGVGSKDDLLGSGTSPLPLTSQQRQINSINDNDIVGEGEALSNNHNITRVNNAVQNSSRNDFYDCPTLCQCEYSSSSQKLEISCSSSSSPPTASKKKGDDHDGSSVERTTTTTTSLRLTSGVRILRISHALLDSKSMRVVLPTLVKNTLVELDLQDVSIEPKSFFTSSIFQDHNESLRKLTLRSGTLTREDSDLAAATFRGTLQPFTTLKSMDSLNICDSSPSLAAIVLQTMPAVGHLSAVNNSLYEIPYETFSSSNQYSIESIDFSRNHLALIPNGLLESLNQLKTLDMSHNRIFHLQEQVFSGLKSLRKLNVSHNKIEYVDAEVFTPLRAIKIVDLSYNDVVQFFEPYFANNKELEVLFMSNMWVTGTFFSVDTALRSLIETERLINSLSRVEKLDISENGMRSIPETLTHASRLLKVYMDGNRWECSCQDRWFFDWVSTARVSIGDRNSTENMWCFHRLPNGEYVKRPFYQYLTNLTMACTNNNIIARTPYKFQAVMGKDKQLSCHAQKPNWPKITWITPSKQEIVSENRNLDMPLSSSSYFLGSGNPHEGLLSQPRVFPDGSLHLTNITAVDYGLYRCVASYDDLNVTHYVHLGMDVEIFKDVRLMSILVGVLFSFSFLFLVLLYQLVAFILERLGIRCAIVETSQHNRHVRAFFDSMEQNKNTQLDWLRNNYNMQAKKIKDNCYSQLYRIRESYATQSRNLGEIRDYGTQQLHTLRDQYNDQVRKVASYSAHQLCKVRENYVFKRNQVCQFSSHQLLRLRETYKWQAQTLNKILENLPRGLNFDTCRGMGACGRTDSIYLEDMMEEDFISSHDVAAEIYQFTHGSLRSGMDMDKMEHVSLLIPPEFVADYKKSATTTTPEVGFSGGFIENEIRLKRELQQLQFGQDIEDTKETAEEEQKLLCKDAEPIKEMEKVTEATCLTSEVEEGDTATASSSGTPPTTATLNSTNSSPRRKASNENGSYNNLNADNNTEMISRIIATSSNCPAVITTDTDTASHTETV